MLSFRVALGASCGPWAALLRSPSRGALATAGTQRGFFLVTDYRRWGGSRGSMKNRASRHVPPVLRKGYKGYIEPEETRGTPFVDHWWQHSHVLPRFSSGEEKIGQVVAQNNRPGVYTVQIRKIHYWPRFRHSQKIVFKLDVYDQTQSLAVGDLVYLVKRPNVLREVDWVVGHIVQPNVEARLRMSIGLPPVAVRAPTPKHGSMTRREMILQPVREQLNRETARLATLGVVKKDEGVLQHFMYSQKKFHLDNLQQRRVDRKLLRVEAERMRREAAEVLLSRQKQQQKQEEEAARQQKSASAGDVREGKGAAQAPPEGENSASDAPQGSS
eukprot:RCo032235